MKVQVRRKEMKGEQNHSVTTSINLTFRIKNGGGCVGDSYDEVLLLQHR